MMLILVLLYQILSPAQTTAPHIIFILADDLGYQDVGFRDSTIRTPHIDTLARTGITLDNHYVQAVCAPTRAALLTGRYPARTGFWKGNLPPHQQYGLNLTETLLPEMLRRNGYRTHGVGKWHVGMYSWDHTPVRRGFQTFFGGYNGEQGYFDHKNHGDLDLRADYVDSSGDLVDEVQYDLTGQYNTQLFTDRAVSTIRTHNTSHPLFLYLAFTAPHIPHEVPPEDLERLYPGEGEEEEEEKEEEEEEEKRRVYSTLVTLMDEGIGRVMDQLRASGMVDNTVVIFSSDNGQHLTSPGSNYPLRGFKGSYLEGGVRSVTIINTPLLPRPGSVNHNLYHVTDWYATFQGLVGDKAPRDKGQLPLDGVDVWESLRLNTPVRHEVLLNIREPDLYYSKTGAETRKLPVITDEIRHARCKNDHEVDYFAIRWESWKLITGGCWLLQGWKTQNGEELRKFKLGDGMTESGWVSGTMLWDLQADPREEHDVAGENPGVVRTLLEKREKYRGTTLRLPRRLKSGGYHGKVVMPWVTLDQL